MLLEASCHCKSVQFTIETEFFYPFMICYCSICRKTNGAPFGVNIKGQLSDLNIIKGNDVIKIYIAKDCERHFCSECGSSLYITDKRWPEGIWPNAACVDTELPQPEEYYEIFLENQVNWFQPTIKSKKFNGS